MCKKFFLCTLGLTSDKSVRTVLNAVAQSDRSVHLASPPSKWGKHAPANKFPAEFKADVTAHILSYRPAVSHYTLAHAPNRRYLPSELNITSMYDDFITKQKQAKSQVCSYRYYYEIFRSMNISFGYPCQDKCTTCTEHNEGTEENHDCHSDELPECRAFLKHLSNAKMAREAMDAAVQKAKSEAGHIVTTVDMQKVISMPKLSTKDYFFSRKLVLFNETFAVPEALSETKNTQLMLWHEGEAGRKAFNVASAYHVFLKDQVKEGAVDVTFVTDNCNSQNKNWTLFSSMARAINDGNMTSLQSITFLYLEAGHTFMAADSVHGSIGTALNRKENIYDLKHYLEVILSFRKNMEATVLNHNDQTIFENEAKVRAGAVVPVNTMKVVQFRRGSFSMFVKDCHDLEEFHELDFLKRDLKRKLVQHAGEDGLCTKDLKKEPGPRGISSAKRKDLLKLCKSIPKERQHFFKDLKVNQTAADLDTVRDTDI